MAQRRVVNIVPNVKIKKELPSSGDEEDCVSCRICNKMFASHLALRNHARMDHFDAYLTGDPEVWTQATPKSNEVQKELEKQKTEQIICAMAPTDLVSLTSSDVSYIIVKAEDVTLPLSKSVRKRKVEKEKGESVGTPNRKEKEIQPITGPFECLQPSAVVADGTCHQIFFSCCEYSVHFRDEHTRRRKGVRCQVCEKPLSGGDDQAPFSCEDQTDICDVPSFIPIRSVVEEVCGAGFTSNKQLSEHMATDHVKLKPFECSVCHKRFTQQGGVHQHMRMHTGDRPFNCTFCPKAFTQKSGLDQHLRIHTKVKPYRCIICSKTFCQSVHLKQHIRTHTQVSPFQCGICQKRFKQSSHLNYHLKNHNQLNMTPDQKELYSKLVHLMAPGKDTSASNIEVTEVSVETEVQEGEEQEQEYTEEEVLMDEHEQLLAEQSIQIQEDGETYILSDDVVEE